MGSNPSYYAVIPANVRYANMPDKAKLLFGELTALATQKGYCWANDDYFAQVYGVSRETINRLVSKLSAHGFISIEKKMTNKGWERKIYIAGALPGDNNVTSTQLASDKNVTCASDKNVTYNNTSINNTELAKANSNKVDKRNPEVQEFVENWKKNFDNSGGNKARQYASLLIKSRGLDRAKGAILAARSVLQEQYAPSITSIQDLYYKWDKLEVFFARKGGEQNKRSITIKDD